MTQQLTPRLIRLRDAPHYLGMDKNRFNREVRPTLLEIPIGKQGIAFDRLEMDAWVEHYMDCCRRSQKHSGEILCQSEYQASLNEANKASGTLTNASKEVADFEEALERVTSGKRSDT